MYSTSKKGLLMAYTDMEIELEKGRTEKLRFDAFRTDSRVENAISEIRSKDEDDSKSLVEEFRGRRFDSEEKAMEALGERLGNIPDTYSFQVSTRQYPSMSPIRQDGRDSIWIDIRQEHQDGYGKGGHGGVGYHLGPDILESRSPDEGLSLLR